MRRSTSGNPDKEVITTSQDAEVDLEAALEAGVEGELNTVVGGLRKKRNDNPFFEHPFFAQLDVFFVFATPTMSFHRRLTSLIDIKFFLAHLTFPMVFVYFRS